MLTEPLPLLIGLGAMKAGTTWMHDYFHSHPQVLASPIKELNFFTSHLRDVDYPHIRRGFYQRYSEHAANPDAPPHQSLYVQKLRNLADRVIMDYRPEAYLDFFRKRLTNEHCCAEISPSYADLSADDFAFMNALNPDTRYLFIMRDPVERLISHLKFDKKLNPRLDLEQLKTRALRPGSVFMRRSRYEVTIRNLECHIDPRSVYYMFYESMFSQRAIAELCAFMGVDDYAADTCQYSNLNPLDLGGLVTPQERTRIANALAETYEFCRTRFGSTIPEQWLY